MENKLNQNAVGTVVFDKVEAELLDLAVQCRTQLRTAEDTFRKMVMFAHKNKIGADRVSLVLKEAGFVDSRVSEFKRIAGEPETYKDYTEGKFGWKPALEKARAAKPAKTGRKVVSKQVKASRKMFDAFCEFCNEAKDPAPVAKEFRGNYLVFIPMNHENRKALTPGGAVISYEIKPGK